MIINALVWLTTPPRRSFTLFKPHPGVGGPPARLVERLIFFGSVAIAPYALIKGVPLWQVGLMLVVNKFVGLVASQIVHVTLNVILYVVSGGRLPVRQSSPYRVGGGGYVPPAGGPDLSTGGMPSSPAPNSPAAPFTIPQGTQIGRPGEGASRF